MVTSVPSIGGVFRAFFYLCRWGLNLSFVRCRCCRWLLSRECDRVTEHILLLSRNRSCEKRESSNLGCEWVGCYSFACCNFLDKIISVGFRFSVLFSFGDLLGLVFLSVWIMEFCGDLWCRRPRFMICSNLSLVSRSSGFWNWDVCGEGIWLMGVCMCFRECVCFREMVIRGLSSLLWLRFPFQRERTKRKTDVGFYFLEDR